MFILILNPISQTQSVSRSAQDTTHPSGLCREIMWPSPVFSLQWSSPHGKSKSLFTLMLTSSETAAIALTDSVSPGRGGRNEQRWGKVPATNRTKTVRQTNFLEQDCKRWSCVQKRVPPCSTDNINPLRFTMVTVVQGTSLCTRSMPKNKSGISCARQDVVRQPKWGVINYDTLHSRHMTQAIWSKKLSWQHKKNTDNSFKSSQVTSMEALMVKTQQCCNDVHFCEMLCFSVKC